MDGKTAARNSTTSLAEKKARTPSAAVNGIKGNTSKAKRKKSLNKRIGKPVRGYLLQPRLDLWGWWLRYVHFARESIPQPSYVHHYLGAQNPNQNDFPNPRRIQKDLAHRLQRSVIVVEEVARANVLDLLSPSNEDQHAFEILRGRAPLQDALGGKYCPLQTFDFFLSCCVVCRSNK
jgi:hypothetical protein